MTGTPGAAKALAAYTGMLLGLLPGLLTGVSGAHAGLAAAATAALLSVLLTACLSGARGAPRVAPARVRTALRDRAMRTAFLPQRDPDAAGRSRPRAPGRLLRAAA